MGMKSIHQSRGAGWLVMYTTVVEGNNTFMAGGWMRGLAWFAPVRIHCPQLSRASGRWQRLFPLL